VRALAVVDELASGQLGLVTYEQLRSAGSTRATLRGLVAGGALITVHRHVYVVAGAPESYERTVLAAVLAAGKLAYASHETAAQLWDLPGPGPTALEVTAVYERCPEVVGVRIHRSGLLTESDACVRRGVPVASVERTIVDLSSRLSLSDLGRLVDDALRRRLTTVVRIHSAAARLCPAPGRSQKKIAQALERRVGETESVLEDFVCAAIARFELPAPVSQHEILVNGRRRRIDLSYPELKAALEAKGFEYHGMRSRFDEDAHRSNDLRLAGWQVLEFTSAFTDVEIACQVAQLLGVAPPRGNKPLTFEEWKRLR
jgi:very-short-patch-repair endonuclease